MSPLALDQFLLMYVEYRHSSFLTPEGVANPYSFSIESGLKPYLRDCGSVSLNDFGPRMIRSVMRQQAESGLKRTYIAKTLGYLKQAFIWGHGEEIVDRFQLYSVQSTKSLRHGEFGVAESQGVAPVNPELVRQTLTHLPTDFAEMIEMLASTGMRSGEVRLMQRHDLADVEGELEYTPSVHKTAHHGQVRSIFLVDRAAEIVRARLLTCSDGHLWKSPRGGRHKPYSKGALGQKVRQTCKAHDLPHWHPHQIRHAWLDECMERTGDEDVTRAAAGHTSRRTTRLYLTDPDRPLRLRAAEAMRSA